MLAGSAALAALALALAWPVPVLLSRARWPARAPATALVLWQAVALAGGLSMLGSLLSFGLTPFGTDVVTGGLGLLANVLGTRGPVQPDPVHVIALSGAALLGGHLLLNLLGTVVRAERERRRHAQLVLLLSTPLPDTPGTRLLDDPAPVAYCLPGAFTTMTVLSSGLLSLLAEDELRAVIEHERAHATQRHDIVLVLFRAWRASLPWFPIAHRAHHQVGLLVEMLADDLARRCVDDRALARAIALVSAGGPARRPARDASAWVAPDRLEETHARIARLGAPALSPLRRGAVVGAALALLTVPTVLLLAPGVAVLLG